MKSILQHILSKSEKGQKQLAVLLDPDELGTREEIIHLITDANRLKVDYLFVGGSIVVKDRMDECLETIAEVAQMPVVLFPGSPTQLSEKADAVLFLSLISGRNAEALIGHHVVAAPFVRSYGLEALPAGYMLVDGGAPTTASYMSNSFPIPSDKNDIAASTALAGEYLGLRLIYMDSGSGAQKNVPPAMVTTVKENISIPLIVGGGVRTTRQLNALYQAGADIVVVGNAIEKDPGLMEEMAETVKALNAKITAA